MFSTAALCNICGLSLVSDSETAEALKGSKDKTDEKASSKDTEKSQDASSSKDSQQQSDEKKAKSESGTIKIKDIIVGDLINDQVIAVADIIADSWYTCQPVLEAATDGTEKYNWSVSGGSCDNNTFFMEWNTPVSEGAYAIKLDITKNDGSFGSKIKEVQVNLLPHPPMPPFIDGIRLYDVPGVDHGGRFFTDSMYQVVPLTGGTTELIDRIEFSASEGLTMTLGDGTMIWHSPVDPQTCTITVIIYDAFGSELDSLSIDVIVEGHPV